MSDDRNRDLVARSMDGYLSTQLLYIAAQLRLADLLRDGPRSSAELAAATGITPSTLHRVLCGLVVEGAFDENPDGRFRVTDAGRLLESDRLDVTALDFFEALPPVQTAVRHFMPRWGRDRDKRRQRSSTRTTFLHSSTRRCRRRVRAAALGDLEEPSKRPATLFDRPEALVDVPTALNAAGIASRCALAPGDFFSSVPAGGDLYVLSRVLHDWDDSRRYVY